MLIQDIMLVGSSKKMVGSRKQNFVFVVSDYLSWSLPSNNIDFVFVREMDRV